VELENTWRINLHVSVVSWCCLHAAPQSWRMSAKTASVCIVFVSCLVKSWKSVAEWSQWYMKSLKIHGEDALVRSECTRIIT